MCKFVSKYFENPYPLDIGAYIELGGFKGLETVLKMKRDQALETVKESGLRGRGGAYFPTGLKWASVDQEKSGPKYIICNADEGEPGTFKDKLVLEKAPYLVLEGMLIAAYTIGASKGYIYIRGEYEKAKEIVLKAIEKLATDNYLGHDILGSGFQFDIEVRTGAGAYVCGEETALIESIEGKRGEPRLKPPFPGESGLWGQPTLINNVETLSNVPLIFEKGVRCFKELGTASSTGTKLIPVSGIVKNKGVYEVTFGTSIDTIINDLCGGIEKDKKIGFIQIGGASGPCIRPEDMSKVQIELDALKSLGLSLGSGALHVVDESIDERAYLKKTMDFFIHESCGRCTPCREGNVHLSMILQKLAEGNGGSEDYDKLKQIINIMKTSSFCGLGQASATAVTSLLNL